MNAIMVDNWSTHGILFDTYEHAKEISDNYGKLLSAVLLWDEIYYPHNEKSVMWNMINNPNISSVLKPIDDTWHMFEKEAFDIYTDQFYNIESSIVAKEAIRYLLLSNYAGLDYFPSSDRAIFFEKYNPNNILSRITRLDIIGTFDNEIIDCFNEYNERFGREIFEIKRPILVDFIIQNTPHDMSYLEFAMQLREEKAVIQYRKYLTDLEIALERQEWKVLDELLTLSQDVVNKTVQMDKKRIGTIEVSVSPFPSFSFSKEFELRRKKVHLTFLDKLSNFAFNGRKI